MNDSPNTQSTSAPDAGPGGGRRHPGKGRRKARPRAKGRTADETSLARIRELLADRPRSAHMLIEHLHLIQDARGYLPGPWLAALAQEMKLPLVQVYEVASFYHNFRIVRDAPIDLGVDRTLTVRVCDSLPCAMAGSGALYDSLVARHAGSDTRIEKAACMGRCDCAPVARLDRNYLTRATQAEVTAAIDQNDTGPAPTKAPGLAAYRESGGYKLLEACRDGAREPEEIFTALDSAGLRGLGGAGFPTGRKWRLVAEQTDRRLMVVNGDESEPGTFKDRHFLLTDPHRVLEGMLIGAWAVGAREVYFYLRDEYPDIRALLERELAALEEAGLVGGETGPTVHLRRGAGSYICGEESAMLESIEGKRGLPRHKPPFPAQKGLFGLPTLINNVETLFWVRDLVEKGPEIFTAEGRNGRTGLRTFSVSGRVREPGVKLAPAGISARELIEEFCGGMAEGHDFKAYLPGGASGGILPQSLADAPLDFGTLDEYGALIGSAALVVLSQQDHIPAVALNLMRFFENESCGQCTPCRAGTEKAVQLMANKEWDRPLLEELARCMTTASICGLGHAASSPLLTAYRFFPEEMP